MALLFDSWYLELVAVLVTLFLGVYAHFHHKFQFWRHHNIPYAEPSFPFGNIVNLILIRESLGQLYKRLYDRYEGHPIVGTFSARTPALLCRSPEMVQAVLVKDFAIFQGHGFYMNEEVDPLSGHLFSMEGTKWKHLRYKLTPTFTSGKMKMMYPTLVACAKELELHFADTAASNSSVEIKDVLARYSTDVIANCAFGIQSNSVKNPDSEFRAMGRRLSQPGFMSIVSSFLGFLSPRIADIVKIRQFPKDLNDFFLNVVRETIDYREKHPDLAFRDFMQLLVRIKNRKSVLDDHETEATDKTDNYYDVHGMTVEQCAAQAFVFFIAGFETSSNTMTFCLYEMALNQDVQQRVREEIDSVLLDHGGEMTYEAIMEMEYLDRVVSETLRKYPAVPTLLRACSKDYTVPGTDCTLKKGDQAIISVMGLHHDAQYYPDPEKFDPERFTEEAKSQRPHYAYLPFGEGPRICIGSRFGLMQTKVGVASLIHKYQFGVCDETEPEPIEIDPIAFVLSPKAGVYLKLSLRR